MAKKEEPKITAEQPQVDPKVMIDGLVQKAKVALDEYMKLDQEQIDNITKARCSCRSFSTDGTG